MSQRPTSTTDCPPPRRGRGAGPIVRAEHEVQELQRALGMEGRDVDGMFGAGTAGRAREALESGRPGVREALEALERRLGKGRVESFLRQGQTDGCVVDRSGIDVPAAPNGLRGEFGPSAAPQAASPAPQAPAAAPTPAPADPAADSRPPKYLDNEQRVPNPAAFPPGIAATPVLP